MRLAILADHGFRLGVRQVLDALLGPEVEFNPRPLVGGIDIAVGMAAEAMHVAETARDAAVAHDNGDLMQRLRQEGPEVPVVVSAAHAGARVAFDGMIQIREAQRVAKEEDWRVVANHVPVAFLGVELQGEAADIALCIGGAALAGDGREPRQHRRLLADFREDLGLGVAGDVMGDGEGPMGSRPLGVHATLRNDLAMEVGQLFDQPDVLKERWAAPAGSLDIEVVADGRPGRVGHMWRFVGHENCPR